LRVGEGKLDVRVGEGKLDVRVGVGGWGLWQGPRGGSP